MNTSQDCCSLASACIRTDLLLSPWFSALKGTVDRVKNGLPGRLSLQIATIFQAFVHEQVQPENPSSLKTLNLTSRTGQSDS
ncbi:hypothetical protein BC567DRAFT_11600 [Phyllosticta citribraziliensis]